MQRGEVLAVIAPRLQGSLVLLPALVVGLVSGPAEAAPPPVVEPPAAPEAVELRPVGPAKIRAAASTPNASALDDPAPTAAVAATAPAGPAGELARGEGEGVAAQAPDRSMRSVKIPAWPHRERSDAGGQTQAWVRATAFGEWFSDNYDQRAQNDDFVALVSRVNFGTDTRTRKWNLAVQARVDSQNLFDLDATTPLCDRNDDGVVSEVEIDECIYADDLRLERMSVRFEYGRLRLTAGDFNVNFARGLGLTVRKLDEIGVDATIKGGRADIRLKQVSFTALAGLSNRQNSDFATRQLLTDPGYRTARCADTPTPLAPRGMGNRLWTTCSDLVAGGRVEAKLPAKVRLGGHYSYFAFGQEISTDVPETLHVAGADLARARIARRWDLFVGGAGAFRNANLRRDPRFAALAYDGYALYAANQLNFGDREHATSVLVEGKFYRDYLLAVTTQELQYTGAPTLEREDQQVPGSANAAGGRVRVDHTLGAKGLTVFANMVGYAFAEGVQQDMFSRDEGFWMVHPYAGLLWWSQVRSGLGVQVSGGYRYERHLEPVTPDDAPFRRKFPHGEFYVTVPVSDAGGFRHSMSLRGEARWETKQVANPGNDNRFVFGNVVLGYAMAPRLNFAFIGGFSSEFPGLPGEPAFSDKGCALEANCLRKPHLWPGAELRVNFLQNSFVRLFAGRQVGGRVCVNGSCRLLPDFEGARAEIVLGF